MTLVIQVCEGCKEKSDPPAAGAPTLGQATLAAVTAMAADIRPPGGSALTVKGYPCIGNCKHRCRMSVAGPERWTWLIGDIRPERDMVPLRAFLDAWLAAPDGFVAKDNRPAEIRPKLLGRVPPA